MTPEQRIVAACIESGVDDLISPGILRNLVRSIEEACSAALRELDAAHEIALKKARADALNAAARQADAAAENYLGSMGRANKEHDHTAERLSWASMDACRYVAQRIRALLEEAGK